MVTSCFIASYSMVDGLGARAAGTALGFYVWLSIGNGIVMICVCASGTAKRAATVGDLASENIFSRRWCIVCGLFHVTWAFTQAPIALVTALRETSIVFALLIGVFFLKERVDLVKVFSTMTTLLGAVLLRFAR